MVVDDKFVPIVDEGPRFLLFSSTWPEIISLQMLSKRQSSNYVRSCLFRKIFPSAR